MSATKPSHLPRHHKGVPEKPALLEQKFCPAPQDSGHKKLTSDHPVYTDFLLGFFCLCIIVIFSDMFCNLWGKITLNGQSIASSSTHGVLATPLQVHDGVAARWFWAEKKCSVWEKCALFLLPPGWPFVGEWGNETIHGYDGDSFPHS